MYEATDKIVKASNNTITLVNVNDFKNGGYIEVIKLNVFSFGIYKNQQRKGIDNHAAMIPMAIMWKP